MRGLFKTIAVLVLFSSGNVAAQEQARGGDNSQRSRADERDMTGDVSGFITDGDGNPVANAEISLKEDEDSEKSVAEAESELDGSFRMEDVEAGVYVVVVGKRGFEALVQKGVPVLAGQEIELRLVVQSIVLGTAPTGQPKQ